MSGSIVLEVAVGLILVYLTFSLFCSAINEWIARFLALRATGLRKGINELFCDPDESRFAGAFHDHPLIEALKPVHPPVLRRFTPSRDRAKYPSYISAATFAMTVLDMAADITSPGMPGVATRAVLKPPHELPAPLPAALRTLLMAVDGDAAAMQARLEQWFTDAMDRVSGWYKRRTHVILFFLGLATALLLNIDSFSVAHQLATEPTVREAMVKQADDIVARQPNQPDSVRFREVERQIAALRQSGLVIGWNSACSPMTRLFRVPSRFAGTVSCGSAWLSAFGIFFTAIALSFGAPFWFDALNKLTNLRQAGAPPADKKK